MPRTAVVYFSQGGTTARVAEAIAAGLRAASYDVDLFNLRDGPPPEIRGYDLLGIGSPVYFYRVPFNVADYLRALPGLGGMPVFDFLLCGSHAFDTGSSLRKMLAERGGKHVGSFQCHGEAYFLGHLREGYLFSPDHPTADEVERATAFGVAVAEGVGKGASAGAVEQSRPPFVYRIERAMASRWLVENVYTRLFRVDPLLCTACGDCMAICPTKNITPNGRGHPVWGRNCLYCLSCEMKCPEDAIRSLVSRPVLRTLVRPLLRYNVGHWAREPGLDHVRVIHRKGRTERLEVRLRR